MMTILIQIGKCAAGIASIVCAAALDVGKRKAAILSHSKSIDNNDSKEGNVKSMKQYIVKYHTDYQIRPFEVCTLPGVVTLDNPFFDHEILYGYKRGFIVFSLSKDRIDAITDASTNASINIDASFKAQAFKGSEA